MSKYNLSPATQQEQDTYLAKMVEVAKEMSLYVIAVPQYIFKDNGAGKQPTYETSATLLIQKTTEVVEETKEEVK